MGSLFGGLKAKSDIPILLRRYVDKVTLLFYSYLCHIFPSCVFNPRLIGKHFCIIITNMNLCSNSGQLVVLFIYLHLESWKRQGNISSLYQFVVVNQSLIPDIRDGMPLNFSLSFLLYFQELRLDEFVTHEVGFEDINKAFELLIEGKCLRCVIWMGKWVDFLLFFSSQRKNSTLFVHEIVFYLEFVVHRIVRRQTLQMFPNPEIFMGTLWW